MRQQEEIFKAQYVPVLPSEVLMVSFDLTHGDGEEICLVAKRTGNFTTIVNAFQGEKAVAIFKLLTTIEKKGE